jgi:hypothetical protein
MSLVIMPFTNIKHYLEFYSIMVPFLFFHWSVNDDTCALTLMEQKITGKNKDETFFGRVMGGIYKMEDNDANKFFKSLLFFLWMFVQFRLGRFDMLKDDLKLILKNLSWVTGGK